MGDAILIEGRLKEVERQQAEEKQHDQDYKERQLGINRWLVILTFGLVLVGVIGNGVALYQGRVAKMAADAAGVSANAASRAVNIAEQAGKDSEKALRLQMRPYLVLSGFDPTNPKLSSGNNAVTLSIKDVGRTPAIEMEVISLEAYLGTAKLQGVPGGLKSKATVADQPITIPMTFALTVEQSDLVTKAQARLDLRGLIQYTDIFKELHRTWIVLEYDPVAGRFGYGSGNKIE